MKNSNYNDILKSYNLNNEQVNTITKVLDRANICADKEITRYMDFLDPYLAIVSEELLNKYFNNINYVVSGGYINAERKMLGLFPSYMDPLKLPLKLVKINFSKINQISHRDVLGSLMGLGLKREKIGDIIINNDIIQIIISEDISEFIEIHLNKIGKYNVEKEVTDLINIIPKIEEYKYIYGNVNSLRLDSVCSEGFGISRNKVSRDIRNDRIKVNFKPMNSPSHDIDEGDLISYRGNGRILLEEILGKTKKDRFKISIKKFI